MEKNLKSFVQECLTEMVCKGVSIHIEHKKNIFFESNGEKTYCSGFFDDNPLSFNMATGKPQREWALIFLHEYGHFEQWKEGNEAYKKLDECGSFDQWINHTIELSNKNIQLYVKMIQECELDCEKRVVKYIKKYKLEKTIDPKVYIKRANSYVFFYNVVGETRCWYKTPPYTIPQVTATVPDHFLKSYKKCPDGFSDAIKKYCLRKG